MAEYVLDFLHPETMLVEKRSAGMPGQVPVDMLFDSRSGSHLADNVIAVTVMPDISEGLQ